MRFYHHKMTLNNKQYANAMALLSKFYSDIKTDDYTPAISWDFVTKITPFSSCGNQCNLCLHEKRFILKNIKDQNLLNERNKLMLGCNYRKKSLLKHFNSG